MQRRRSEPRCAGCRLRHQLGDLAHQGRAPVWQLAGRAAWWLPLPQTVAARSCQPGSAVCTPVPMLCAPRGMAAPLAACRTPGARAGLKSPVQPLQATSASQWPLMVLAPATCASAGELGDGAQSRGAQVDPQVWPFLCFAGTSRRMRCKMVWRWPTQSPHERRPPNRRLPPQSLRSRQTPSQLHRTMAARTR